MAKGKRTCKILKEIRRQIAAANGIDLVIEECRYKGDCLGTCPRCEAEVRYLEEQLRERRLSGRAVALAGVSAGMLLMAGCTSSPNRTTSVQPEVSAPQQVVTETTEADDVSEIEDDDVDEGEPCIDYSELTTIMQGEPTMDDDIIIPEDAEEAAEQDTAEIENDAFKKMIFVFDDGSDDIGVMGIPPAEATTSASNDTKDDGIYEVVDEMPKFPGGDEALMDYVNKHVKYSDAIGDFQGLIEVKFVVKKDGSIGDIKIVNPRWPDVEAEAIRVVRELPNFTPGRMNGEPVDVWLTIPVLFKLRPA